MDFIPFRKKDYIIFYIIFVVIFIFQLSTISFVNIIGVLMGSMTPTLILGTITNLIFKNK